MNNVLKFFSIFFILILNFHTVQATKIEDGATVVVMDFGTHPGAVEADLALKNAEKTTSEYVIYKLLQHDKYVVMERDTVNSKLKQANLNTISIIDPNTAKQIGELLKAKYLIYGNVIDLSLSNTGVDIANGIGSSVKVDTVIARIVVRMMNTETGEIIAAVKGEGKSKKSFTNVGSPQIGYFFIGTEKVTQDSVHNALQKAAFDSVEKLTKNLMKGEIN